MISKCDMFELWSMCVPPLAAAAGRVSDSSLVIGARSSRYARPVFRQEGHNALKNKLYLKNSVGYKQSVIRVQERNRNDIKRWQRYISNERKMGGRLLDSVNNQRTGGDAQTQHSAQSRFRKSAILQPRTSR